MTEEEWSTSFVRVLGMLLNGQVMDEYSEKGRQIKDDIMLLLLNSYWEELPFKIPGKENEPAWEVLVDTADPKNGDIRKFACGETFKAEPRSLVLLRQPS